MGKRLDPEGYLSFTIEEHGGKPDARGLMSLADARKIVKATTEREHVGGDHERFHAAVCSLADAAEARRVLATKKWFAGPSWVNNTGLVERYGVELMPWLVTLIGTNGKPRSPGTVTQLLEWLATPDALDLLFRIWAHDDDPDREAASFVELQKAGWKSLAELAERGHERAHEVLAKLAKKSPSGTKRELTKAIGAKRTAALLSGSATTLDAAAILEVLDAAAKSTGGDRLAWPSFAGDGHFQYHAMRLIAARAKTGDDWGILIEVVQGDQQGKAVRWPATIQHYRYGSRIPDAGGSYLEDCRALKVSAGPGTLVERIRAALAHDVDVFWSPAAKVIGCLDLGARAEVLVDTGQFAHVVGKQGGKPATSPSKSATYRSVATAIVTRDPDAFVPGAPNTKPRPI